MPGFSADHALEIISRLSGQPLGNPPELVILPQAAGGFVARVHAPRLHRGRPHRLLHRRAHGRGRGGALRAPDPVRGRPRPGRARRRQEDERARRGRAVPGRRPAPPAPPGDVRPQGQLRPRALLPERPHPAGRLRPRRRFRQRLDGRTGGGRAHLRRLHLRLLLQALRPARARRQRPAPARRRPPRPHRGLCPLRPGRREPLLRERVLRGQRHHGLRRGPARGRDPRRPELQALLRRPGRGGARADARGHPVHVAAALDRRVGGAQRVLLGHDGHERRVLLPGRGQRAAQGGLPAGRGHHDARRRPLHGQPRPLRPSRSLPHALRGTAGRRRHPPQLRDLEPGLLPGHRGGHEPDVGPERPGRRGRQTASRSRR